MKSISRWVFFAYVVLATLTGTQGVSHNQQIEQLDNSFSVYVPIESDPIDNDDSDSKYLPSKHFLDYTEQASFQPLPVSLSLREYPLSRYSIRAPPQSLS